MRVERRAGLLALALAACTGGGDDADAPPVDSDVETDAPPVEPDACDGERFTLDLSLAPETFRRGMQARWEDAGAAIVTEGWGSDLLVSREGDCLRLHPAALSIRLTPTRCGGRRAVTRVTPSCNTGCTELVLWAGDELAAKNSSTRRDAEETLSLAPARVFDRVVVQALDAVVCALEVELAPLPPDLVPEDTGAPF